MGSSGGRGVGRHAGRITTAVHAHPSRGARSDWPAALFDLIVEIAFSAAELPAYHLSEEGTRDSKGASFHAKTIAGPRISASRDSQAASERQF
jgi:hypothetical protein